MRCHTNAPSSAATVAVLMTKLITYSLATTRTNCENQTILQRLHNLLRVCVCPELCAAGSCNVGAVRWRHQFECFITFSWLKCACQNRAQYCGYLSTVRSGYTERNSTENSLVLLLAHAAISLTSDIIRRLGVTGGVVGGWPKINLNHRFWPTRQKIPPPRSPSVRRTDGWMIRRKAIFYRCDGRTCPADLLWWDFPGLAQRGSYGNWDFKKH